MEELPKAYDPKSVDATWYEFWEQHGFFHADANSDKEPYTIVIPPPNITGNLHMGHALVNTLQDVLIRKNRMDGKEALWVPGVDHAGISTQTVVERKLMQETGKTRRDFEREEFLKHVWAWKETHENNIVHQLKKLGCSCDWERSRFTLDERNCDTVRKTFKKLFDDGLIYRGDRLVNWDKVTRTALADDEVEYEDRDSFLWHFRYPLSSGDGYVQIATTRPETMLGDTAVAVAPSDERYAHLIGQTVTLPLMDREIPIVADHHVDPEFGTGVVKITPAHDPNDYEIGLRHDLPFINIMTPDGIINENGGRFAGLSMEQGRDAVVAAMEELGHLVKKEPHSHRVGISYRSKAVIEPFMSKQWFIRMDGFAKKLAAAANEKRVKIIPKNWENTYFHWVNNLRDWCISRQLWWGHRIPIWYHVEDPDRMICWAEDGEPPEVTAAPDQWRQDDDVLDTWFSSGLWPFATLGWPEQTPELKRFYPTSVLVTGHDILFFWVARMILMGEYVMGEVPFPETFLHGLIFGKSYWRENSDGGITYCTPEEQRSYDLGEPVPKDVHSKWEKMSKSKGNIIDPLEVIDEYGTDAIRMALCAGAPQSRQIDLDRRRFEEFKNFANKVWNGARFIFRNLDANEQDADSTALTADAFSSGLDLDALDLEDRWILQVLNRAIAATNEQIDSYAFDHAAMGAYDFYWKDFCAYYLELVKPVLFGKHGTPAQREQKQKMLVIVLAAALRLLHPMAPFITEELFQKLKQRLAGVELRDDVDPFTANTVEALLSEACIVAPYPRPFALEEDTSVIEAFELVSQVVYSIRNIRGEMKVPPGTPVDVWAIGAAGDASYQALQQYGHMVSALVRVGSFTPTEEEPRDGFFATGVLGGLKLAVKLPDELVSKERTRLEKAEQKLKQSLERVQKQLANEEFTSRAPEELVAKQRALLTQTEQELSELRSKLEALTAR